jgi:DNA-binding MarR family transcriptional regulator
VGIAENQTPEDRAGECREVLDAIRRLVQVIRRSAQAAERGVGLSAAQLFVLRKLGEAQSLNIGELAHRTATSQSSVSEVVQRLVTANLVSRQRSPRDGRSVELSLTDAGRELVGRAPQAVQDHILEALGRMSSADRSHFAKLLNRLLEGTGIAQMPVKMLMEEDPAGDARSGEP